MPNFENGALIGQKAYSKKIDMFEPIPEGVEEITIIGNVTLEPHATTYTNVMVPCLTEDGIVIVKNIKGWYIP